MFYFIEYELCIYLIRSKYAKDMHIFFHFMQNMAHYSDSVSVFENAQKNSDTVKEIYMRDFLELCEKQGFSQEKICFVLNSFGVINNCANFVNLDEYVEFSLNYGGKFWALAMSILTGAQRAHKVASMVGQAFIMVKMLNSLYKIKGKKNYIIAYNNSCAPKDLVEIEKEDVQYILNKAEELMKEATRLKKTIAVGAKRFLLIQLFTSFYIRSIKRAGYDVYKVSLKKPSRLTLIFFLIFSLFVV